MCYKITKEVLKGLEMMKNQLRGATPGRGLRSVPKGCEDRRDTITKWSPLLSPHKLYAYELCNRIKKCVSGRCFIGPHSQFWPVTEDTEERSEEGHRSGPIGSKSEISFFRRAFEMCIWAFKQKLRSSKLIRSGFEQRVLRIVQKAIPAKPFVCWCEESRVPKGCKVRDSE